jgi:predicted component of type VI protein secretion system
VAEEEVVAEEEEEMEAEMDTEEEGPMDADDVEPEAEEGDEEVSITDEEAQDIIDLADKLRAAMEGGADEEEGEEEMDMGDEEAEMDMDMEEPGMRDMMEEELYEAALRGLDIEVVDDKAEKREALMNEAKAKIYERVIKRLLKESKK